MQPGVQHTDFGWQSRRVELGHKVQAVCYFDPQPSYLIATSRGVELEAPREDDHHRSWKREGQAISDFFHLLREIANND